MGVGDRGWGILVDYFRGQFVWEYFMDYFGGKSWPLKHSTTPLHIAKCQGRENQIVVLWENCSHLRILYGQQINSLFKKEKCGTWVILLIIKINTIFLMTLTLTKPAIAELREFQIFHTKITITTNSKNV